MIYRFRIVLDVMDDVFRDIEIKADDSLEDLHNAIVQAFEFEGSEMASFYMSNEEWSQGEEIVLFDMSEGEKPVKVMNATPINKVVSKDNTKMIYVYDFLSMWTFYVELADIAEAETGRAYPNLMFSQGIRPETPPDKQFESEIDLGDEFDLDSPEDDFLDFENLDDLDLDQLN